MMQIDPDWYFALAEIDLHCLHIATGIFSSDME